MTVGDPFNINVMPRDQITPPGFVRVGEQLIAISANTTQDIAKEITRQQYADEVRRLGQKLRNYLADNFGGDVGGLNPVDGAIKLLEELKERRGGGAMNDT